MAVPIEQRGYARPELLAETAWLADHLADPRLRIIDARAAEDYAAGHIPGSINLSGRSLPRVEGEMGPPEDFAALVGSLGISNDATVVVYDEPRQNTGMIAWGFMYYGHRDVRVLDGGLFKWAAEGRPITTEVPSFAPTTYEAVVSEDLCCSLGEAKASLGQPGVVFWDTRSREEYEGTASSPVGPTARLGRIPSAVHLEWSELLDPQSRTFKTAAELKQLLASIGITPESRVLAY